MFSIYFLHTICDQQHSVDLIIGNVSMTSQLFLYPAYMLIVCAACSFSQQDKFSPEEQFSKEDFLKQIYNVSIMNWHKQIKAK